MHKEKARDKQIETGKERKRVRARGRERVRQ